MIILNVQMLNVWVGHVASIAQLHEEKLAAVKLLLTLLYTCIYINVPSRWMVQIHQGQSCSRMLPTYVGQRSGRV